MQSRTQGNRACTNCHARKVRCDLASQVGNACSRCVDADLQCRPVMRRRRPIRSVAQATNTPPPPTEPVMSPQSSYTTEVHAARLRLNSLGANDEPRTVAVPGIGDVSQQTTILVDFLSQDFSRGSVDDYQVTFVDKYSRGTRILAEEFGRGLTDDVSHHRDAPFVKRQHGSMPRSLLQGEQAMLELQGAFVLPSATISDSLVAAFFDRVHPLVPIVDRGEFMKRYHALGSSNKCESLLLLQSILLSGSTAFECPGLNTPSREVSWKLFARAKALVDARVEQDRLTLVQAHILFSTFAGDSCDDTIQNMWLSIGSAVRIAQGLGMHRTFGKAHASPAMRREWKRIWWTLVIHDTFCSFEWGRPRAINMADSDMDRLLESDLQPESAGSLPNAEHTAVFLELSKLSQIICDWLDILRPVQNARISPKQRLERQAQHTRTLLDRLMIWFDHLPPVMRPPTANSLSGYTLWTATLHIAFQAALLRFSSLLPESTVSVQKAATMIITICEDLFHRDLLGSLWSFAAHELDLALGYQARAANSQSPVGAAEGREQLRRGLPLLQHLGQRNTTASQGSAFYEQLLDRLDSSDESLSPAQILQRQFQSSQLPTHQDVQVALDPVVLYEGPAALQDWPLDLDLSDPEFTGILEDVLGDAWGWHNNGHAQV